MSNKSSSISLTQPAPARIGTAAAATSPSSFHPNPNSNPTPDVPYPHVGMKRRAALRAQLESYSHSAAITATSTMGTENTMTTVNQHSMIAFPSNSIPDVPHQHELRESPHKTQKHMNSSHTNKHDGPVSGPRPGHTAAGSNSIHGMSKTILNQHQQQQQPQQKSKPSNANRLQPKMQMQPQGSRQPIQSKQPSRAVDIEGGAASLQFTRSSRQQHQRPMTTTKEAVFSHSLPSPHACVAVETHALSENMHDRLGRSLALPATLYDYASNHANATPQGTELRKLAAFQTIQLALYVAQGILPLLEEETSLKNDDEELNQQLLGFTKLTQQRTSNRQQGAHYIGAK